MQFIATVTSEVEEGEGKEGREGGGREGGAGRKTIC